MKVGRKVVVSLLLILCLVVPTVLSCGEEEPSEGTTLIIGDLTDLSGSGRQALQPMTWALEDYCDYVNEQGYIPGVTLKVVSYDTQYKTDRFSPGYDYVMEQGATVVWTAAPYIAETLKARAAIDKTPIVCATSSETLADPPGWVFCLNANDYVGITATLKWISESHWDYSQGVPKIGMVGYNMAPNPDQERGLKDYCQNNPGDFELIATTLAPYGTMTWSAEVDALKGCNYIVVGTVGSVMATTFIDQYRTAGGKAKFLGYSLAAYVGAVVGKVGWDKVDGTLTWGTWGWWSYDSSQVTLAVDLLFKNHPKDAYSVMGQGIGGIGGAIQTHYFVQLLKAAIEDIGEEEVNGQAIYDSLQTVTVSLPGYPEVSFKDGERQGGRYFHVWEWVAAKQDLVMATDGWVGYFE